LSGCALFTVKKAIQLEAGTAFLFSIKNGLRPRGEKPKAVTVLTQGTLTASPDNFMEKKEKK
jgi:hypothetical protein